MYCILLCVRLLFGAVSFPFAVPLERYRTDEAGGWLPGSDLLPQHWSGNVVKNEEAQDLVATASDADGPAYAWHERLGSNQANPQRIAAGRHSYLNHVQRR